MTNTRKQRFTLVVVSGGTSDPSSTRMLADQVAQRVTDLAGRRGNEVATRVVDLRELATEITTAMVSQLVGPNLQRAVAALGEADGIVASTPVYAAGASGLFTSFFQVLDNDLLIAKPVALAATAGTARHASSSTSSCGRSSPTCGPPPCRPRCSPPRRIGATRH
jgi:FMN reductase